MTTAYITGDRSINPLLAVMGAAALIKALSSKYDDLTLVTGDAPTGFENALAYLYKGSDKLIIKPRTLNDEGKPDFDAHNKALASSGIDLVCVMHSDPLGSNIVKSVMANFPEDKVKMVLQGDDL